MADRLPVPPELQHLIEKREAEERRLGKKRRSKAERREYVRRKADVAGPFDDAPER